MNIAYIIRNNTVIATVSTGLPNGTEIQYSHEKIREELDANRDYNLLNAKSAKISRAQRWEKEASKCCTSAVEINPLEFLLVN